MVENRFKQNTSQKISPHKMTAGTLPAASLLNNKHPCCVNGRGIKYI